MELKELSCNWKKLQAVLKNDTSKAPKRKASDDILQPQRNGTKRQKIKAESRVTPLTYDRSYAKERGQIMGLGFSKESHSESLALWAEDHDIPAKDLAAAYGTSAKNTSRPSVPEIKLDSDKLNEGLSSTAEAGKYIAIDCEMVGVGPDPANDSALARVSIVNFHGHQLYDSFVLPKEPVTDFRTFVSGITPQLLRSARPLETVQADVAKLLEERILVGHAVRHDLEALFLGHPKRDIRDTSKYSPFRQYATGRTPGLKKLAKEILGLEIQGREHSSVEDARATMLLYRKEKDGFETEHARKWAPQKASSTDRHDGNATRRKESKNKKKGIAKR